MTQLLELYTLFHEQAVCERGTKMEKKAYFMQESKISTWLYCFLACFKSMSLLFKEQKQKRLRMGF